MGVKLGKRYYQRKVKEVREIGEGGEEERGREEGWGYLEGGSQEEDRKDKESVLQIEKEIGWR